MRKEAASAVGDAANPNVLTVSNEHALWSPPPYVLAWAGLEESPEADLAETLAELFVVNQTDAPIHMELTLLGDRGTTRSTTIVLGAVDVDSGSTQTVTIDLAELLQGATLMFAGSAVIRGRVWTQDSGKDVASVTSPMLYFHTSDDGLRAYDEQRLHDEYRSGDVSGLVADDQIQDTTDRYVDRVVQYEPPSPEELTLEEASDAAEPDEAPLRQALRAKHDSTRTQRGRDSLAAAPDPQLAYMHTLCVNLKVLTNDSGFQNSVGITEDHWITANTGQIVDAQRIRVRIGSTDYDTGANGCVNFSHNNAVMTQSVLVYAYAQDASGNLVRIHSGSPTDTSPYPSYSAPATHSTLYQGVNFSTGTPTTLNAGNYDPRWTAMGALAKSLDRYIDGLSGKQFHLAEDTSCDRAFNYHNNISSGASYIKIPGLSCDAGEHLRSKFLVSHEYGHAYLYQFAGIADTQPIDENATAAAFCSNGGPDNYKNNSEEWSSLGFREGYAHFVSARIWNNKAGDGQFHWDGVVGSTDLERWNPSSAPGGWLVNMCCGGYSGSSFESCVAGRSGHGTIGDWLRTVWDQHTAASGCTMDRHDMAALFAITLYQTGLSNGGFFPATSTASLWFGSGCSNNWTAYGCHNGIDRQGAPWGSGC